MWKDFLINSLKERTIKFYKTVESHFLKAWYNKNVKQTQSINQGGFYDMYDACDVLHASYCSADVANHVLREYGEGSMGKGIRKLAGEMLTIGGQQSYGIGYDAGVSDTYPTAFKDGVVTGSIICVCTVGLIGFGVWCTKKLIERHNAKKEENQLLTETAEEVSANA